MFVCLSACLSVSGCSRRWKSFRASKRQELREYEDISPFNMPLYLKFSIKSEKTVPFECTLDHTHSLILNAHALEGYSSHFVYLSVRLSVYPSVCLSVVDLEDGGLLALQRHMNLKSTAI